MSSREKGNKSISSMRDSDGVVSNLMAGVRAPRDFARLNFVVYKPLRHHYFVEDH